MENDTIQPTVESSIENQPIQVDNTAESNTSTEEIVENNNADAQPEGQGEQEQSIEQQEGGEASADAQEQTDTNKAPTVEELQAKLDEYKVRDEEDKLLKEKLGIQEDVDSQTLSYINLEQQVINQANTQYLGLCNEYGVDADPNKFEISLKSLEESDPRKYYEFVSKYNTLNNVVSTKRQEITKQAEYNDVGKFAKQYEPLLESSPALTTVFTKYISNMQGQGNMYSNLNEVMSLLLPVYEEAFNIGKTQALKGKAKQDTSVVSGGIATTVNPSHQDGEHIFTRDEIKRLSYDDYSKNEKTIMRQMREGKIQ